MILRYVPIDKQGEDIAKTQRLFETAFPEEERPPFSMMLAWKHDTFFGVYLGGEFVALVDLVIHKDLVYVFFLAVEEGKRGQGIGSQILQDLENIYSKQRVFLLAEETGKQYPDNEIREKRLRFYAKNFFYPTGDTVVEFGVTYEVLCFNGRILKSEFVDVMRSLIGEELAKKYYGHIK